MQVDFTTWWHPELRDLGKAAYRLPSTACNQRSRDVHDACLQRSALLYWRRYSRALACLTESNLCLCPCDTPACLWIAEFTAFTAQHIRVQWLWGPIASLRPDVAPDGDLDYETPYS
jgi:hypothetical protein